jgi:hypothetical protein
VITGRPGTIDPAAVVEEIEGRLTLYRTIRGLAPLVRNDTLATAAATHATRMRDAGFFDHVDVQDGSAPWDRVAGLDPRALAPHRREYSWRTMDGPADIRRMGEEPKPSR